MMQRRLCENPEHKGDNPPQEEGTWWLKDPEWKMWCPVCVKEWWKNKLKGIKIK